MSTAGRTVAISGLTVAISLTSLLLFPQMFLRSMGFGGMAAVLVAMIGTLTILPALPALPALLAVLGPRVDALRIPFLARRARTRAASAHNGGAWARVARSVMRRPAAYAFTMLAGLLALGAPFLHFAPGGIDYRVPPEGTESREVHEALVRDFPGGTEPLVVAVTTSDPTALRTYLHAVSEANRRRLRRRRHHLR